MDTLLEEIIVFGLIVVAALAIGIPIALIKKKMDANNAPESPDELQYILKSKEQKQSGWSFQDRYRFLKEAGFRKANIDKIMGQVERFEEVALTDQEMQEEIEQVLTASDDPEIDAFLLNTYTAYRDGVMAHVPRLFTLLEARSRRPAHFVTFYKNLFGPLVRFAASHQTFDEDEVYIAADEDNFFLTNQRLLLFKKKGDGYSVTHDIPVEQIQSYTSTGWWTQTLDITLKNQEHIQIKSLDVVPQDDVIAALCEIQ